MTLHAAKGLEFEIVYLPGWEEGLFPSQRSIIELALEGLEEERRIAYVGITRAKRQLYISFAERRRMYHEYINSRPSRFIAEIPRSVAIHTTPGAINMPSFSKPVVKNTSPLYEKAPEPYKAGAVVLHPKFGKGVIIAKNNDCLEIAFAEYGIKTIKQNYVKLS